MPPPAAKDAAEVARPRRSCRVCVSGPRSPACRTAPSRAAHPISLRGSQNPIDVLRVAPSYSAGKHKCSQPPCSSKMPAQVLLMAALHDHHLGAGLGIIHPRGHHHVPPIECPFANGIRFDFLDIVRIVANDAVATFASSGAAHRGRNPIARSAVIDANFCVLVAGERKPIAPARLIPGRLD